MKRRAGGEQYPGKRKKRERACCTARGCDRPPYAQGLCQTHYRQRRSTGKLQPIRPYRKRSPGTVKFSGLRLSPHCVKTLEAYAAGRGLSGGAAIAEILEDWYATRSSNGADPGT
jgi:hypothetical protein